MKVKGGFLMYLLAFLGIIVGVILILLCIMIFSPGTSIFGLEWISKNTTGTYASYEDYFKEISNYDTVVINSLHNDPNGNNVGYGYYNVDIRVGVRDAVNSNIVIENMIQGLVKTSDKTEFNVSFNEEQVDGANWLYVNVVQANTWLASTSACKITLNIPASQDISNTNFIVNTGSGSIDFGGSAGRDSDPVALRTKSITATSTSGSIVMQELTTASTAINLKTGSGRVNIYPETLTTGTITIESESGRIILPSEINTSTLTLVTDKSTIDGGNVNGNLTLDTKMGVVRLGNINGNVIGTEKLNGTDIRLNNVSGELGIPQAISVILEANKVDGFVNIVTEGGRIYIGSEEEGLSSRANISTTSGEIKVFVPSTNNQLINLTTTSGRITAYIATSNGHKNIITENGSIDVKLAQSTSYDLISETKNTTSLLWDETEVNNDIVYRELRGTDEFTNSILKIKSNTGKVEIERLTELAFN